MQKFYKTYNFFFEILMICVCGLIVKNNSISLNTHLLKFELNLSLKTLIGSDQNVNF